MNKFKFYLKYIPFLFLFLVATPIFSAHSQNAAITLAQLLNRFQTFQAQFTQTTMDAHRQVLQQSSGIVMLMRPNRFRWETKNPTHQIVIADGKTLWIYDVDLKQATQQDIQNSPMNPAKLLCGDVTTLLKQFTVHMVPHQNLLVFQLIPKKPMQDLRFVTIAFYKEQLQNMHIQTAMEQTNIFKFFNVVTNGPLSAHYFKFTPPEGVEVLR